MKLESNKEKDQARRMDDEFTEDGQWLRHSDIFDAPFGDGPGECPVEADRYYLIWGHGCNWSHRQVITLRVLGLDKVIRIADGNVRFGEKGIDFSCQKDGVDPVLGIHHLSQIYFETDPEYKGRWTIPCVVDLKERKVAHNEDDKLSIYFETAWSPFHMENAPDLYPEHLRAEIDRMNDILYEEINDGVYKIVMAKSQKAYDEARALHFGRMEWLDELLGKQRFLLGDYITDSDIRLFATLVRYDMQYYPFYTTNNKLLIQYPNLWGYARDLFQTPGFHEMSDLEGIAMQYRMFLKKTSMGLNQTDILPGGPDLTVWEAPHGREALSRNPEEKFLRRK